MMRVLSLLLSLGISGCAGEDDGFGVARKNGVPKDTEDSSIDTETDSDSDTDTDSDSAIDPVDADGDGVPEDEDCDDNDATVYPSADEICDGLDNDCDGAVDENPTGATTWYADADGDGYGDPNVSTEACDQPPNTSALNSDCDDTSAIIRPGATEVCDGVDNDCDGAVDGADPGVVGASTWYYDYDADGYGQASQSTSACDQPSGYASAYGDCNDANADVYPGAPETDCTDPTDYNCDGTVVYADVDGDGTAACEDCDDSDAAIHPSASEICDSIDNDCDGLVDDDDTNVSGATTWYGDNDGDGYGYLFDVVASCSAPSGYVADATDCNDSDATVFPSSVEYCDGVDNDCDGVVDDNVVNLDWYPDADGDGYGEDAGGVTSCAFLSGWTTTGGDCDDTDATILPGAVEACDDIDNDCDGLVDADDPDLVGTRIWYLDQDGDGYGHPVIAVSSCPQPSGYVLDNTDCGDTNDQIYPGAIEQCDNLDNDCNGTVDDNPVYTNWYPDVDGDDFGDDNIYTYDCLAPTGYIPTGGDCDDSDDAINPDAEEVCDDLDNDCDGTVDGASATDVSTWYPDADSDGFGDSTGPQDTCDAPSGFVSDGTDCDDTDATVNPDAIEYCDSIDNNCDGSTDGADAVTASPWYPDLDGDGYGDTNNPDTRCDAPTGYLADGQDCDDTDATVNPDGSEVCDGVDNDCNGTVDDAASDASTFYTDLDGDGYGDPNGGTTQACSAPSGFADNQTDCNDGDANTYPGADELCDSADNDCDGSVDETGAIDAQDWYTDADGDGFGDSGGTAVNGCQGFSGMVADATDCDDDDAAVNTSATEICDGVDNDCDGTTDVGASDELTVYTDNDGDGYGDDSTETTACSATSGTVTTGGDCDDTDSNTYPSASELCDNIDNDCNGSVDDNVTIVTWYADVDGDGFGDANATQDSCNQPGNYEANSTDCDDTDSGISPDATEVCDGVDNDCDGDVDEDSATGMTTWYIDDDGDGYGTTTSTSQACDEPSGYAATDDDCDDSDSATYPGAPEICDGIDNDCNGTADDNTTPVDWYQDSDGDGWGNSNVTVSSCLQPSGYVYEGGDCDETDAAISPDADELCDGVDNNCDGDVDEDGATDATTYYSDADGDGFGDADAAVASCSQPTDAVADDSDCDDTDAGINADAVEACDTVDNDCDGDVDEDDASDASTWYPDVDGDSYGDGNSSTAACDQPSGYIAVGGDCDDTDATVSPGATESCNGADDNCDGDIDEGSPSDGTMYYADADADGYGDASLTEVACTLPSGHVADDSDCDDNDANTYPGATEICDGIDNNCNSVIDDGTSAVDWFPDGDGDGYGNSYVAATSACAPPSGMVQDDSDCNDADATIHPGAEEVCDALDNDCDGSTDGNDATDVTSWYEDSDGDGYGDASGTASDACFQPSGWVADDSDCDDTDSSVNPDGSEVCDNADNDCNGVVDGADSVDALTWYADTDGDGYGDESGTGTASCSQPSGYVADDSDCDDTDSSVSPIGTEVCNNVDDDCDGTVDGSDAADVNTWYADSDSDNYGDGTDAQDLCSTPTDRALVSGDCDDTDATINPDAVEVCDNADNDCDGTVDEDDASDALTWYVDADEDDYGDSTSTTTVACDAPNATSAETGGDCDDNDATVYPGASELCDGVDNDCNGTVDDNVTVVTWYLDADGDGVGVATDSQSSCSEPSGYVLDSGDCDDTDATAYPGNVETCDGVDNDCDGNVDGADSTDATGWYADTDSDGYGDPNNETIACSQPSGSLADNSDCDDSDAQVNPGATEVCDGVDNDCNGTADGSDATDLSTFYTDNDGDGYGDASGTGTQACDATGSLVDDNTDCNDTNSAVNPDATEECDSVDNDCDGDVDEADASDASTWFTDADGDGEGSDSATGTVACNQPSGSADNADDCDDSDASVSTSATETCNGVDDNCDGVTDEDTASDATTWYADTDNDGYGDSATAAASCSQVSGYVADDSDCDDSDFSSNPGATETCDGVDNDCNGVVDNDTSAVDWYTDSDGDGFGDASSTPVSSCAPISGMAYIATDCDDNDAGVNPNATELCDQVDNDCDGTVDGSGASDATSWYTDSDQDGYGASTATATVSCSQPSATADNNDDCDDTDADISPAADEICDSVDNDCDGAVDGSDSTDLVAWYTDSDGDGYGDSGATATESCSQPTGTVSNADDCNDSDASISPDASEVCDLVDNDCDDLVDGSTSTDATTFYADGDSDTYGDPNAALAACSQPTGYVTDDSDCDDTDATISPVGTEVCDSADNDCDGTVDENDATDASTWYVDSDGDGYGDTTAATQTACDEPSGYVATSGDCDDTASDTYPGATERCDSIDNDCNGTVDDNVTTDTWYRDADGDGYGLDSDSQSACAQPSGYVLTSGDCDDGSTSINPDSSEVCDFVDNDCDGTVDGAASVDATVYYVDADDDGYGSSYNTETACAQPTGTTTQGDDCDDDEATTYPGATEYCDGADNDCNGLTDDGATDVATWYPDTDSDAFGSNTDAGTEACDAPTGYVADNTDCDDSDAGASPSTTEICDNKDNDCDGTVDEDDAANTNTWYADGDSDGFGDADTSQTTCDVPSGYVATSSDCDDGDASVNPDATETCNSVDDNCDGAVDEDTASDADTWYLDNDGDGYGNSGLSTASCDKPSGYVSDSTDCDDSAFGTNPGATEICDSIDNDCNGSIDDGTSAVDWYVDNDNDGFGDPNSTSVSSCSAVAGYSYTDTDCNDNDDSIHPNASEVCDDVDNDCDGTVDGSSASDVGTWYLDSDGDGYGAAGSTATETCDAPSGYVDVDTDCDDTTAAVNPGATEVCNGVDDDCDGSSDGADATDISTWYTDADGDGYGSDSATGTDSCSQVSGSVANAADCNDSNAGISPDATEVCDSVDNDCDGSVDGSSATDATTWYADSDGDTYGDSSETAADCDQPVGYVSDSSDCDDTDADISPVGTEVCDSADNDCDGTVDENDATDASSWYVDADSDGYGSTTSAATVACDAPSGQVSDNTDCNDSESTVNPGASERCNSVDDDCNGTVDDNVVFDNWYPDTDGDGYGATTGSTSACAQPSGSVLATGDCDDTSSAVNPGATEVCNGIDDDCDGSVDGSGSADAVTWYIDTDGDGYGSSFGAQDACSQPSGTTSQGGDCDDTEVLTYPGATETCDDVDNDCNDVVDDDATDTQTWHPDNDGDGFGDSSDAGTEACDGPTGYVSDDSDCDDSNSNVSPSTTELCDSVDNDCDGTVDEDDAADTMDWYPDSDGDGFGDSSTSTTSCDAPSGYVSVGTDCDDSAAAVNPDATETCNSVDDNCDGTVDEDTASDAGTWYADSDGDGYGNASSSANSCSQPSGYVSNSTDCNDSAFLTNPDATEICDSVDNDCNGLVDDGTGLLDWYVDSDGDGFGNPNTTPISSCTSVSGRSYTVTDCDDTDATIHPNATEVCDDVDNDCDGTVDGSASSDATAWYLDSDGDGYGASGSTATNACDQPSGYVSNASDCNDGSAAVNPGATEVCNSVDDDCNGVADGADSTDITTWYTDSDSDGYGSDSATGVNSCSQPSGSVANAQDCNDSNAAISPAATEVCDSVDNDCDGTVDGSSATDATTFYADSDGDGYGDSSSTAAACSQPSGYVSDSSDCDDTDATISPVGTEVCDSADNDCDGTVDEDDATDAGNWYTDGDSDGYGSTTSTAVVACNAPTGRVGNNTDCNDTSSTINPGATERCNSIDDNCNGTVDDNVVYDDWYPDSDGDGYGANTTATSACVQPSGYVLTTGDCNDAAAAVNPAATEVCNNVDDDCDGAIDGSGSADAVTYYTDTDGDGYGVTSTAVTTCTQPSSTVTSSGDCDDTEVLVYPGADEYCDDTDNDCDGTVDESAVDQQTWYPDLDGDGFGDGNHAGMQSCEAPTSAWMLDNSDCNDSDTAISPSSSEFCSTVGVDDDCDGTADEADAADTKQWYADDDSDGYGDPNDSQNACTQISGRLADNTDCDDTSSSVNPGEDEVCDGVDNDCDGVTDPDNSTDATSWYNDSDGDGYGGGTAVTSCSQVTGRISTGGDCNDSNAQISPGEASDAADCQDNDCDGSTDEDASYTYTHDTDIQPIWNANCTGCHPSNAGLSLTSGFAALVNVASSQSSKDRVEPCLIADSYLWHKLEGTQSSVGGSGGQMPQGGTLSASDKSKIETWIIEGAPQ